MRTCYKFFLINILLVPSVMVPAETTWRDRLFGFEERVVDFVDNPFTKAVGGILFTALLTASLYGTWKLRELKREEFMFGRGERTRKFHVPRFSAGHEAAIDALLLEIVVHAKDPKKLFESIAEAVSLKISSETGISKQQQMKNMQKALALHLKTMYADGNAQVLSQAITNLTRLSDSMPKKSAGRANVVKIKILFAHALAERFPLSSFIQ